MDNFEQNGSQQNEYHQNGYQQNNYGQSNDYQQNMYQGNNFQQNSMNFSQPNTKAMVNCVFNKHGELGFNLMAYIALAAFAFMSKSTFVMVVTFAMVMVLEKDKDLGKVLLSFLAEMLLIMVAFDVWGLVYTPVNEALYSLLNNLDRWGSMYEAVEFLKKAAYFLNNLVLWMYTLVFIVRGIMNLSAVSKNTYKPIKIIEKYFN